jgi:hypothetical protein
MYRDKHGHHRPGPIPARSPTSCARDEETTCPHAQPRATGPARFGVSIQVVRPGDEVHRAGGRPVMENDEMKEMS